MTTNHTPIDSPHPTPARLAVADGGREQPRSDSASPATFDLYVDEAGEWRWRLIHRANGELIAESGEGYTTEQKAREGLSSVKVNAPEAPVEEDPEASAKARAHSDQAREEAQERFNRVADDAPAGDETGGESDE